MVPGTRMPGFWPEGQSPAPDVLNGDSEKQINLIADYILYLGQARGGTPPKQAPAKAAREKVSRKKMTIGMAH